MNCPRCTAPQQEGSRWCSQCGYSLSAQPAFAAAVDSPPSWPGNAAAEHTATHPQLPRSELATFGERVGARIVDGLVMLVVMLVGLGIAYGLGSAMLDSIAALGGLLIAAVLFPLAELLIIAIVRIGGEGNQPGQTLGKAAFGIRVVREDGSRAGYGPAFGRFFLNLVPILGFLSCVAMLWTRDGRAWHDSWTGTRVEKRPVPEHARRGRWSPAVAATCLALVFSLGTVVLANRLPTDVPTMSTADDYLYDPGGSDTGGTGTGTGGSGSGDTSGGASGMDGFGPTVPPTSPDTSYHGLVTIEAQAATDPEVYEVARLLDDYFRAINTRDFDAYLSTQAAHRRADLSQASFLDGYGSTTDSDAAIIDIVDLAGGERGVVLTFTSTQDAADGPDGQTCTDWTVTYALTTEGGRWLLDGVADGADGQHLPCE